MLEPLCPENESDRLCALRELQVLDSPPEERFDRITRIASQLFDVPIAVVSLVDEERQWFKSRVGLDAVETPRGISFCGHAILQDQPLIVENALKDTRFHDNPLVVGAPHIRFYAGYPLRTADGFKLGTLCLIDRRPRVFTERELAQLRDLAALAENELTHAEMNRAMHQLRVSETTIRALLDHMPQAVLLLDCQGMIQSSNSGVVRMFGYDGSEVRGKSVTALLEGLETDLQRAVADSNGGAGIEAHALRKDGSRFPAEVTLTVMQQEGRKKVVATLSDVSRRKESEARAAAEDQARRRFFANATHELRTPLSSILGFADLMVKREFDEAMFRELAVIISQQATRLVALINEMLDLARIEAGKGREFEIRRQPLAPIVQAAVETLAGVENANRIRVDLDADLPPLNVDGQKLQRALTNLLSNSIKYSPDGGDIEVTARALASPGEAAVVLQVRDHGIGMTADQKARIFEGFYRANQLPGVPGTGLGMTICKEIVELHGGRIEVDSTFGAGTTVTLRLPVADLSP